MPSSVEAIKAMSWEEMQTVFATIYADEIAAVADGGEALMRERVAALGVKERQLLREALEAVPA